MKYALPIAMLLTLPAHADEWTGKDKAQHFIAGAAIASVVTVATSNETLGFLAGSAAGVAKEAYDGKRASVKDLLVTVAGAYVGARVGGFIITPSSITYRMEF